MPLYEYECTKCRKRFEKIEKTSARPRQKCPQCGGRAERLLAPSALQFKGSGWYVTDYARKTVASAAASSGESTAAASGEGSAGESKEAKEKKEAAPAKESTRKAHKHS